MNPNFPPKIVGAAALYKYVKDIEKNMPNKSDDILILDGGNFFQGHPIGLIDSGKTVIEWMNKVGYDAIVPGNNDFLFGPQNLLKLSEIANFPFLACNIKHQKTDELLFDPYKIINIKGSKVGILGLANSEINETVLNKNLEGIKIEDSLESMNFWVSKLVDKVDILILLTSSGVPWDRDKVYEKFINTYTQYLISEKNLSNNTVKNYLIDLNQFFSNNFSNTQIDKEFDTFISKLRRKNLSL